MANKIRWKKGDYISLGKAVSTFNKTVANLSNSGIILPDLMNYDDLKKGITTRKELNRMVNALKRFRQPTKQVGVTINEFNITKWEFEEVNKARKRAERRLTGELAGIESRALGTGNTRANEIRATLESFEKFALGDIEQYKRISSSIIKQGKSDYELKKALIFQENFIKAYEKMGRKEVVIYAKSFRNPLDFWEAIKNSEFTDIKLHYDIEEGRLTMLLDKDDIYYNEIQSLLREFYTR